MAEVEPPNAPPPPAAPPLPFEFVVTGRPVSHQSNNRRLLEDWRRQVRTAAAARWAGRPTLSVSLRIAVAYYHAGAVPRIDGDNMLKPIQDALIGLVYDDDGRITDATTRKTPIDGAIKPRYQPLVLLEAFSVGDEFVHVVVDLAPGHEVPLR